MTKHVCPYCQTPFEERDELVDHLTGRPCAGRKRYRAKHRAASG